MKRPTRHAFSMTEMLVVIAVLVALLGLLFPLMAGFRKSGQMTKSMAHMRQIAGWITLYAGDNRDFVLPSQFDYSQNAYPGQVRSAILEKPVPIRTLNAGTVADTTCSAAQRGVGLEPADARMIGAERQFQRRTHHARRFDPPDPGLLEIEPGARNMAADGGEHAGQAGPRIVRPAHHLDLLRAIVDQADLEFIGVGMGRHLRDFGHHETFKAGGAVMDAFELEPQRRQGVGHFAEGCLGVQMFLEPTEGEFHRASPPTRLGWSSAAKP